MIVRPQHRIQPRHARRDQLALKVGRGVDQDGLARLLDQDRAALAGIFRVGRIAGAPGTGAAGSAGARHAARRTAAEDRDLDRHAGRSIAAERSVLPNSRKKLSDVARASSAMLTPLSSATLAAVWATKAGSLRLPRLGIGAR